MLLGNRIHITKKIINTYLNIALNINCNVFPKPHEYYGEFITNFTSYHDTVHLRC